MLIGTCAHETANGINTDEIAKIFQSGTEFLKATAGSLQLQSFLNAPKQISGGILGTLGELLPVFKYSSKNVFL